MTLLPPHSAYPLLLLLLQINVICYMATLGQSNDHDASLPAVELPKPILAFDPESSFMISLMPMERNPRSQRPTLMEVALQASAREGLHAMTELYTIIEPDMIRNGQVLESNHPAALLSKFGALNAREDTEREEMAAFATISASKAFRKNFKFIDEWARQSHSQKISLRKTALEGLCPPRDPPTCMPASERYRTHDGTCNNKRRPRWGGAQMPFNRFLPPQYGDGIDTIRNSIEGGTLSSSRFISLLVHGARDGEAQLTLMTAQWGQLLDHDLTSTAQPRSINGSVPSCCGGKDFHPSCFPIKVPLDDPWLAPLKVRCLEFLRSAPAQRRDCVLSWREQTNQVTSYIDASPIYSSSSKSSDNARIFRKGLLIFGRGNAADDVCQRGAISSQCIRAGDGRSGEQPGLLALHHVWVGEHNRIALELSEMNLHWSDEKVYQETRRIIGAMFQHITYREFLPIVLGREVCKLFDLELLNSGYSESYDSKVNPTVANSFAAAAFRFGHSLIQNSYLRCDRNHQIIGNNVSLHEEFQRGDIGSAGSLHRLLRGLANQKALKRDEFITPELTNHLFQTPGFPFGLDLAAINIQRGRDHGIAPYTAWRVPCGLTPISSWEDFTKVVGPESAERISHAYRNVHDIDLFVGGIAERPVVGGLVGPTFACIIAQQFSNSRKGDRFWYENGGFESSFTPAQLQSLRRVSLAQVLCRAVGGGTFQQHIFIPADFPGNNRLPCGVGPLSPIDLAPWLEQDPFKNPQQIASFTPQVPERVFDIVPINANGAPLTTLHVIKENKAGFPNRGSPVRNTSLIFAHVSQVDFIPNSSTGFQRPKDTIKINDKLDLKRKTSTGNKLIRKPTRIKVNNKLDKNSNTNLNFKDINRFHLSTTTRRTVVINNIPVELRSANSQTVAELNNTETQTATQSINVTDQPEPRGDIDDFSDISNLIDDEIPTTTTTESPVTCDPNDCVESTTIYEDDIFDIFSTLTEPTITDETTQTSLTLEEHSTTKSIESPTISESHLNSSDLHDSTENTTIFQSNLNSSYLHDSTENITAFQANLDTSILLESTENATFSQLNLDASTLLDSTEKNMTDTTVHLEQSNLDSMKENIRTKRELEKDISTKKQTIDPALTDSTTYGPIPTEDALQRSAELKSFPLQQPIYERPQKVLINGPNADQYEIEINIRQTNKNPPRPITSNFDYTTAYNPYNYDRYSSLYATTTASYAYYQQLPTSAPINVLSKRTKPPTIIYLNEHDLPPTTTSKLPSFLSNIITFATNGFGNKKTTVAPNTVQKEKPMFETSISIFGPQNSNIIATPQYTPQPQSLPAHAPIPYPMDTSSLTQSGGFTGAVHASSSAISAGHFGAIAGIASSNGADNIFSFNIRPRPGFADSQVPETNNNYELVPPRRPTFTAEPLPSYLSRPSTATVSESYQNSPFSTIVKRPQSQTYFSRKHNSFTRPNHRQNFDYDYSSRTSELLGNFTSSAENENIDDDYDYDIYEDKNNTLFKKFNKDGYLRPEHMTAVLLNGTTDSTETTITPSFDNTETVLNKFMITVLNNSDVKLLKIVTPPPMTTNIRLLTNAELATDSLGKHLNSNEYKDEQKATPIDNFKKTGKTILNGRRDGSSVAFAPLKVLTKPERPDHWVIFNTTSDMPVLPTLPEVHTETIHATEVPLPFKILVDDRVRNIKKQVNDPKHLRSTERPRARDSSTSTGAEGSTP